MYKLDREKILPKVKVPIPGPNARAWTGFHMSSASIATYVKNFVWDRSRPAKGPFCTDVDGNVIIDFVSHVGSAPLGYNHPELVHLSKELAKITPDRYAGADFIGAHGPDPKKSPFPTPSHMHKKLLSITKQFRMNRSFLCNTGAEAVENAIKFCYDTRRNNGYGICFDGAFHGRSLGALSLNRSKKNHTKWFPRISKTFSVPFCDCNKECFCGYKVVCKDGTYRGQLDKLLTGDIGTIDPAEVAYIIIEPVQGEGGYKFPNKNFIREVAEVARVNKIPLVVDEIQSGMGRTGRWWASEHYGITPDIITSSKALQVGAVIGKDKFFPDEVGRVSGTWAEGNAIATAVGCKIIEIIEKQKLLKNAVRMGNYMRRQLVEIEEDFACTTNARGLGLMMAIDINNKKNRDYVVEQCLKKGLLVVGCGHKSIRFLPPLDVRKREIDIALDIFEDAIDKVR